MGTLVYYSTKSGNTHRFMDRLGLPCTRIPQAADEPTPKIDGSFILVTPTYGGGHLKGAIPPAVARFLREEQNRKNMRAVISSGNTNFGEAYALAGKVIAFHCKIPNLFNFELFGTPEDVNNIRTGVLEFWNRPHPPAVLA